MAWLVTGGAGYIGSHVVAALREAGRDVVVVDDLSSGDARRVDGVPLVRCSVLDTDRLVQVLQRYRVRGIVHLAAKKSVEESVARPLHYYRENVEGMRSLLEAATRAGVGAFVYSSSAAVYGTPGTPVVSESSQCRPLSPYGTTKLIGEHMLADVAAATGLSFVALRYFNVAGAATPLLGDTGTSNLVPMVFQRLARREAPLVFGDDYPTRDGTCIRDFIHVADVAAAHVAAARALDERTVDALTVNVGRGDGISVREMIAAIRSVTRTDGEAWAEPLVEPRRPGDPPAVVASADRAWDALGWRAVHGLDEMVSSAWAAWRSTEAHARPRDGARGGR